MSSSDSNDFSQQPVPSDQTKSSSHIALIIIGGTIAIPAFLMAAQLSNKLGFFDATFDNAQNLGSVNALDGAILGVINYNRDQIWK